MPPKRKRNDPGPDNAGRPSPHRPSDTAMGQHDRDAQDGGNRRRSGPGGGRNNRNRAPDRRDSAGGRPSEPTLNANPPSNSTVTSPPASARRSSSSLQPPPQPAPLATNASEQARPPALSSGYEYVVLTEDKMSAWDKTGRSGVVQHGITSRGDEDVEELSTITQEFIQAVLENRLSPVDAGSCMKDILGPAPVVLDPGDSGSVFDAHSLLIDIFTMHLESRNVPLEPQLRDFIIATETPPRLLREILEPPTLERLGLVRDRFAKQGIRYATNLLYRQSNYNLLREETEGYSKLIGELYWASHSLNQEQITLSQINTAFERIKGLIGTFDLDVGRVLDVVFDVFASTMMRTFRYFTMFLRVSSWWPHNQIDRYDPVLSGGLPPWALPGAGSGTSFEEQADMDEKRKARDDSFWNRVRDIQGDAFFEIGGRQATDAELDHFTNASSAADSRSDLELEWIKTTKTLPPPGNRVAAQLYGFKLRYYTSPARDKDEIIPANLFFLAAYLVKIGFISLPDLYAHLWPEDDKMDAVRDRRVVELEEKERKDRQGAEPNALLRAGALPDDMPAPTTSSRSKENPGTKSENSQKEKLETKTELEELPEPKEVLKADLLSHLLLVGAIPEALFMLGRFPWLPEAYPDEIYLPINRILIHSIDKLFQATRPKGLGQPATSAIRLELTPDQSGVPKGDIRLAERELPKVLKWPHANGFNRGTSYEHYLREWADNVPVCQTVDDLFTLCGSFLNVSGVNIGRSPLLVKKLAVIGSRSILSDKSEHNMNRWQDLLKRILIPAANLSSSNVDVVDSVWDLLKNYPPTIRFGIYAECYEGQISRLPAMVKAFNYARLDTLAILKRLAANNIPASARSLAKVALYAPGIVCKVALGQIEAYNNLISAFVECAQFFTELGHDVLVWSLMTSLGGKQRSRTQESSVLLTSKWLQALSQFTGKVFAKYARIDPTPVLQYVNDQLARGNSTDLVILKQMINCMGGIVSDVDFTDAQLAALSGGEELRKQTLIGLGDKRFEDAETVSAARFMRALGQSSLAPRLLIGIAQHRQAAIYRLPENETHIKYLATLIDDSQQVLVQYVELLRSNLKPEQFDTVIPSIPELLTDFGLETSLAFLIGRMSLGYYLTGPGSAKARRSSNQADDKPHVSGETTTTEDKDPHEAMMTDSPPSAPSARRADRFLEVLAPIIEAVQSSKPRELWDSISPDFYVLFWALQTGDLSIPGSSYNAESIRLQKEQDFLRRDRSDMTKQGTARRELRKTEVTQIASRLSTEATQVQERVGKTRVLLLKSSSGWITAPVSKQSTAVDALIEECLVPRIHLSPGDADFCHRMVRFLHDHQVANFKITTLYDRFFNTNRLRSMIFDCTVREAEFFGKFIKLALSDLSKWHKSKDAFEKEALKGGKHVGFALTLDDDGKPETMMDHGQFRDLLWSWHRNLAAALKSALQGLEWMHIRNAITVLMAVLDYFPAVDFQGRQFVQVLQKIAEREATTKNQPEDGQSHRVDLSVTANTAISALKKHEKKWQLVQDFRPNISGDSSDDKKTGDNVKSNPNSSNLRPSAAEFRPQSTGDAPTRPRATAEDEDGEVRDAKGDEGPRNIPRGDSKDGDGRNSVPSRPPMTAHKAIDSSRHPSRPATPVSRPAAPSSAPGSRRETPKGGSALSNLPLPPGLPSRPDVPMPSVFTHDQRGQIRMSGEASHARDPREPRDASRDARDPRDSRNPREARESRGPREARQPEPSRGQDRGRDNAPRDLPRDERERPTSRLEGPPRWEAPLLEKDARTARDGHRDNKPMPPPSSASLDAPGASANPERSRFMGANAEPINPARAAMISDGRPSLARQVRDDSRDRSSRHNQEPVPARRGDRSDARTPQESTRDDRPGRPPRPDHPAASRENRNDPMSSAPVSRGDRGGRELDRQSGDRSRDPSVFHGPPQNPRATSDHSRPSNQEELGRLERPSVVGEDSAPTPRGRGRNSALAASSSQPPAQPDGRFPGADQPPTGPAASRPRRGPGGVSSQANVLPTGSPGPANPPASGVHPDRLRHINPISGPSPPAQAPLPSSGANSVGVHPDRLGQIGQGQGLPPHPPPPSGPSQLGGGRPMLPPHSQTPDRAPNGPMAANTVVTPTGPSAANDRNQGGSRRQLAGINNMLRGTHAGGPSLDTSRSSGPRTRPSRQNLANSDAMILTGGSPVSTPVSERSDPFPNERPNGDERSGRSDRGRRHHDPSERSSRERSSRHDDRERSPARDPRPKEHREYRDREPATSGPGPGDRDLSRRSGRGEAPSVGRDMPPPDFGGNGGRVDPSREQRHRGEPGIGGRHEEFGRGSGGGGRGGMVSNNSMGASRGGDDHRSREPRGDEGRGSRKRRSEEGGGPGAGVGGTGYPTGPAPDSHKRQRQR